MAAYTTECSVVYTVNSGYIISGIEKMFFLYTDFKGATGADYTT